jgi:threonine/homoserine/homoserine lactone efflux protein
VWGSLAVLGLTALLTASPRAYLVVKVLGVGYLLLLAVQSLRGGADHDSAGGGPNGGRPFLTGLATNLLNPKIAVFYTALLPTLAPPGSGAWGLGVLVLLHAALTVGWLCGYACALDRARELFQRPRVRRALDRVTGVVLLGFAVRLATEHS